MRIVSEKSISFPEDPASFLEQKWIPKAFGARKALRALGALRAPRAFLEQKRNKKGAKQDPPGVRNISPSSIVPQRLHQSGCATRGPRRRGPRSSGSEITDTPSRRAEQKLASLAFRAGISVISDPEFLGPLLLGPLVAHPESGSRGVTRRHKTHTHTQNEHIL